MRTTIKTLFVLLLLVFVGCATAKKINTISPGMTKESVIRAMGEPNSVSGTGNTEYLHYKLSETSDAAFYGIYTSYYVQLVDGRVVSYGRLGDFDTTKDPTYNINTNNKSESGTDTDKMYQELVKLKQLLDEGIITQSEFDRKKKEIIEKY